MTKSIFWKSVVPVLAPIFLLVGCKSSSPTPSIHGQEITNPPFQLPESKDGVFTAQRLDTPLAIHEVKTDFSHAVPGTNRLAFSVGVPKELIFKESNRSIITPDGSVISFIVFSIADEAKSSATEASFERLILSHTEKGSYVARGPQYWGLSHTITNKYKVVFSVLETTDGHGHRVFGYLDFPPSRKMDMEKDMAFLNTCLQSIKVHE